MHRLPDELVVHIAGFLDQERRHKSTAARRKAQHALAALARTSKRNLAALLPLLYLHPILSTRLQALSWTRTYTRLVNPFERAKRGTRWPPEVLKPKSLTYRSAKPLPGSFPGVVPALHEVALFSNLRRLAFVRCSLDSDFLPLLLAPGTDTRDNIQSVKVVACTSPSTSPVCHLILSFLLEAPILLEGPEDFLRAGLELRDKSDEEVPEYDWDAIVEAEKKLVLNAHTDWSVFKTAWNPEASGGVPIFFEWNSCYRFSSLNHLALDVRSSQELYLIFYSASFPTLRILTFGSDSEAVIDDVDFQTLRHSITRSSEDQEPGRFEAPSTWGEREHSFLHDALDFCLTDHARIPPLSPTKIEEYKGDFGGYGGPRLDALDMSRMDLRFDVE
ncbi:hypothetical protein JCM8097_001443 [Rhodosporidiobolus ruineniae]